MTEQRELTTVAPPAPALSEAVFRHRGALLVLTAVPIVASAFSGICLEPWEGAVGGSLLFMGAATRFLAVRRIGKRARVRTPGAARLLSEGLFGHVRNPLYVGNLAIATGSSVLSGLGPWTLLAALYVLVVYHFVVRVEERMLAGMFGERYATYVARVPRWLPRLRAAEPVESGPAPLWPWKDVFLREGPTMLLGVVAAFGGLVYIRTGGPGAAEVRELLEKAASICHAPLWALSAALIAVGAGVEGLVTDLKRRRHERAREAMKQAAAS